MSRFIKIACLLNFINLINASGVRNLIKITFIYGNHDGQAYTIDSLPKVLENPNFDMSKTTAIYGYGFTETIYVPSVRKVVDAYQQNGDFNFMVISCDSIFHYNVFNANEIGEGIADGLIKIFESGYSNFHLVGFSLGAQIAGVIGRNIKKKSDGKFIIPRITGLDPGQIPPFFNSIALLSKDDAEFVDVIHAETKNFGSAESIGNANFWINGGIFQPMCGHESLLGSICSHLMAPKFWAECIKSKNPKAFQSRLCENYQSFKDNKCNDSDENFMGLYVDKSKSGNFYLKTNYYSPYSKT